MDESQRTDALVTRHLRSGWIGLLVFLILGIALEVLHGFKAPFYLDTRSTARRLMWTLAHAHGTVLSLVQLAFAAALESRPDLLPRWRGLASWGLTGGQVLLPLGFFAGGLWLEGGEPGVGIFLVPVGGACLVMGLLLVTLGVFTAAPLSTALPQPPGSDGVTAEAGAPGPGRPQSFRKRRRK